MAEQKEETPSFRISYFPLNGRGAPLRAAAYLGGLSYEDNFIGFAEHQKAKVDGTRRWRGLPELTVFDKDGKELATIGQSNGCIRYIGKAVGLYPENPVQRALIDEVLDGAEDIASGLSASVAERNADKKKAMRLALMEADKLPLMFNRLEVRLEENERRGHKNGYIVGDSLSVADLKVYFGCNWVQSGILDYIDGDKLVSCNKRLSALCKTIKEQEGMQKFETEFAEQVKQYKENKVTSFKKAGKAYYASF